MGSCRPMWFYHEIVKFLLNVGPAGAQDRVSVHFWRYDLLSA